MEGTVLTGELGRGDWVDEAETKVSSEEAEECEARRLGDRRTRCERSVSDFAVGIRGGS